MKLKIYKTVNHRRALRVTIVTDYLDHRTFAQYCSALDCLTLSNDIYISIFRHVNYPMINIDEYFNYIELMGIDLFHHSDAREESFSMLIDILETKYGIEYADPES